MAELETVSNVLRSQLDKAAEGEAQAVRDVQRALDRSEFECTRLRDRVTELESKSDLDAARISSLEKDVSAAQELVYKRERTVREERHRAEAAVGRVEELRSRFEAELEEVRGALQIEQLNAADAARSHRLEMDGLKKEVAEKIPRIAASAVERLEMQWAQRLEKETAGMRAKYEAQMEGMRHELLEAHASQAEREARQRAVHADERAELERLRLQFQRMQRRNEDLEQEVGSLALPEEVFYDFVATDFFY